jgi:hypothetical protein
MLGRLGTLLLTKRGLRFEDRIDNVGFCMSETILEIHKMHSAELRHTATGNLAILNRNRFATRWRGCRRSCVKFAERHKEDARGLFCSRRRFFIVGGFSILPLGEVMRRRASGLGASLQGKPPEGLLMKIYSTENSEEPVAGFPDLHVDIPF